jgi:hypothetical protein
VAIVAILMSMNHIRRDLKHSACLTNRIVLALGNQSIRFPEVAMSKSSAAKKHEAEEKRRDAHRTVRGWAIALLLETHAIGECLDHSHLCDRSDPEAWHRAREFASRHPFPGCSSAQAVAAIDDLRKSIGVVCPECK